MISSRSSCGKRYPDQAALIAGVKSGEQEAVGCLYRHLYEKAFPSVRKLVKAQQGSEADAEDLFQEAFLKFRRKIIEGSYVYQPSAAVATYFYELYRYAWRDELKSARRRTYGGEVIPEAHGEAGGNAEQQMLRSERERFLRAQVERLGKQCATLLRLFIWNNWSLESIANEMGITPQSAKNQKYRCMKRLRDAIL